MIKTFRLILGAMACISLSGCASAALGIECQTGMVLNAQMVLMENRVATINGASSQIGTFTLTNHERRPIRVSGWIVDGQFFAEYPVASLWRLNRVWEPIVPLMGSFTSSGDHLLFVPPGGSMTLLARTDFGVPIGISRMRLSLKTAGADCVISDAFDVTVRE